MKNNVSSSILKPRTAFGFMATSNCNEGVQGNDIGASNAPEIYDLYYEGNAVRERRHSSTMEAIVTGCEGQCLFI